jgi:hypothetical protein
MKYEVQTFSVARCLLSRIIATTERYCCVAMGMLLHSNDHLQISTVAYRLLMFVTCGKIPWKAPTCLYGILKHRENFAFCLM